MGTWHEPGLICSTLTGESSAEILPDWQNAQGLLVETLRVRRRTPGPERAQRHVLRRTLGRTQYPDRGNVLDPHFAGLAKCSGSAGGKTQGQDADIWPNGLSVGNPGLSFWEISSENPPLLWGISQEKFSCEISDRRNLLQLRPVRLRPHPARAP